MSSPEFQQKIVAFWQRSFGRVVETAFYVPVWTFWRKISIEIKTIFCRFNFQQKKLDIWGHTLGRVAKTASHLYGGTFCWSVRAFKTRQLIWTFSDVPLKCSALWQIFLGRVVKTQFWVSKGLFRGNFFFRKIYFSFSGQCAKYFRQGFQNPFLCNQRYFSSLF